MKTLRLILLSLSILVGSAYAQNYQSDWSEPAPISQEGNHSFCGMLESNTYFVATEKGKWTLFSYAGSGATLDQHTVSIGNERFTWSTALTEKIALFSTELQDGKLQLMLRFFDGSNFSEARKLMTAPYTGSKFIFNVSPNKEFVAIACEAPFLKGKNEEIHVALMNTDAQLVFNEMVPFVDANRKFKVNVPVVNNNGTFFLLKRIRDKTGNKYYAYSFTPSGGSMKTMKKTLSLRGKKIQDVEYKLGREGNLYLAGYYAGNIPGVLEGLYFFKLDENVKAMHFNQKTFGGDFLVDAGGKKALKKDGGLRHYHTNQLQISDGLIYLSASESIVEKEDKTTFTKTKLAISCMTLEGEVKWEKAYPIVQVSANDRGKWNTHYLAPMEKGLSVLLQEHNLPKVEPNFKCLSVSSKGEVAQQMVTQQPEKNTGRAMIDSKNVSLGSDGSIFFVRYSNKGSEFAIGEVKPQ